MSKSIELSRSGRTIFRKAEHEKPRRFYLRSFASFSTIDPPLLFLFVFSRAKTRNFTSYSVHVREFFRCTRGVAFGERGKRSGEFLASRRSDSEVSLFSRGFLESRPVFRASRFLLRPEENIQSQGEGEFSRIIAREVLLAGE